MTMSTLACSNLSITPRPGRPLFPVRSHRPEVIDHTIPKTVSNRATHLAESLSNPQRLHIEPLQWTTIKHKNWNLAGEDKQSTPTPSPKEVVADRWREIHSAAMNWDDLLHPLCPWLQREIVKYGEFAQATYDAFDFDPFSEYCGSCRYNRNKIFETLRLDRHGYNVSKYIYAMSHIDVPKWLERIHLGETWSKDSNWMGYVAVSNDEETRRLGWRDIVVAWRGTVAPAEWYEDFQRKLEPIGHSDAKVEHGFRSIYTSKSEYTRYNKTSASEQAMKEIKRLVQMYKENGEAVSLTITGHSLGGALALLNAYEAATSLPSLPTTVISFGAPRVGNIAFRDELRKMGVKTLRAVIKQDVVPLMPGLVFNESLLRFLHLTGMLDGVYTHVGAELKLDVRCSPYLKHGLNLPGFHSLETYLHLVDRLPTSESTFRSDDRRDVALVNKTCDMLVDELRIPPCWYQFANKGLVCNERGRWVKPKRELDDIPSPIHCEARDHAPKIENRSQERHKALCAA